jgi:surface carbohydrate biosynthesis protein
MTVLIPIESFKRDALSRIYLANYLSKLGIRCIIGNPEILLNIILPSVQNAIWLGRFISLSGDTNVDVTLLDILKKQNGKMYFLHDEGAFYADDNYLAALTLLHNPKYLNHHVIEYIMVWGEFQKKNLEKLFPNKKIVVSGMYRFDLLKGNRFKTSDIKERYGSSYVLINTRFPESNILKGEVGVFDKRNLEHYLHSSGELSSSKDALDDLFLVWSVINESFSHFVYAIYKLISLNASTLFVIRPHPVESPEFYKSAFSMFKNVIVDNSENISDHLFYADLVIHNECTTGVESVISGKPTINFVSTKRKHIIGTKNMGLHVSNDSELVQAFNDFKNGSLKQPENESEQYLINLKKNFFSADFIADILKDNLTQDSKCNWISLYTKWNYSKFKTFLKFQIFIPLMYIFKVKSKLSHYSYSELNRLFKERCNPNMKTYNFFNCLVVGEE